MDNSVVQFMVGFLQNIWRLFTSWEFPLLGFTPAQLYFFMLVAPLTVRLVKSIIALSVNDLYSTSRKVGRGMKG